MAKFGYHYVNVTLYLISMTIKRNCHLITLRVCGVAFFMFICQAGAFILGQEKNTSQHRLYRII